MQRRIYSLCIGLCFLMMSTLFLPTATVLALTATTTRTPTSTAIPGADFVGTPLSGNAPLVVQFTHINSSVLSSCTWNFGDGTSQSYTLSNANVCPATSHTYTTDGAYTVSLSVMKVTGATNSNTKTDYIRVGASFITPTATPTIGCGSVVVVTSTPSPTRTPTPRTATATTTPSCGPIYVTATPGTVTAGPDLTISSINSGLSGPACANMRIFNVTVVNNGNAAAGTFVVSYSVGGVAAPDQTVSGLAAGQSVVLAFPAASGSGMTATATADSTNLIAETNESNNTTSAMLPIPSQTATCTPTATPTGPTITPSLTPTQACMMTSVPMTVAAVTSPTSALTQVINVTLSGGSSVTITSQAGTFTSTTRVNNVFSVTVNLVANSTNNLTIVGTVPAIGGCASYTRTATATIVQTPGTITVTPSLTPSRTPTVSPTPTLIDYTLPCTPVATIAAPFTKDGVGSFCWQSSNLGAFINSWNLTNLTINGTNYTNQYVAASSYPAKLNGLWYIQYNSNVAWGHFEAK